MKVLLLSCLLFLSAISVFGQKTVRAFFKRADEYYEHDKLDSALLLFKEITKQFPDSPAYSRAFYNVGYVSWQLHMYKDAISVFKQILQSNFNDNDYGPGSGLMSEPFALYKHRASYMLSDIYIEERVFDSALYYLKLSDKKYPYKHFCGNEYAANSIDLAVQYSKCYDGLGEIDKAIDVLWKHVFYNGMTSDEYAVEQMKIVLPKKYTHQQIQEELLAAENTIYIKRKGSDTVGYIRLFKNRIKLPEFIELVKTGQIDYMAYIKLRGVELYKANYLHSDFYEEFMK